MATIPEGMSASHFDIMFTHWGETLTLNRYVGDNSNISGDLSDDYDSDESITGILIKPKQEFQFFQEGEVEKGETYLMLKYADHSSNPVKKRDKVTFDGDVYEIEATHHRRELYYYHKIMKID